MYCDFHIHSVYSPDSLVQPKTLVDMLVSHSTIKVAAITDHDSVRAYKITRQLAAPYLDILIIPGIEITTTEGDMLILGTDEMPPTPWTPENLVDYAKSIGAVSIVAHPYRPVYGMGDRARNLNVDAIEVLNGGTNAAANEQAKQLAKEVGLPGTAGSDAHQTSELFSVYTKVQASLNIDDVLNAIKKGHVSTHHSNRSIHF